MPHVEIKCFSGRTDSVKKECADKVANTARVYGAYLKQLKSSAKKNLEELVKSYGELAKKVEDLEKTCKEYKGRFLLDEGKITLEEFNNGKY